MLTKTEEQILVFLLSNPEERLTIRGIAKRLGKSYTLVYNNIADLDKKKIIRKQDVPPGQIISLNEFAPTNIFIEIELKRKKEFLQKYPWIQVMLEDILMYSSNLFFVLLVFGSYAKGTKTAKSDLDLLIIAQNKGYINEIENAIRKAYTKVKKSLNFADINDFEEMIKNPNKLNIGNEAKKFHIVLYGLEEYYQLIKRAYRK